MMDSLYPASPSRDCFVQRMFRDRGSRQAQKSLHDSINQESRRLCAAKAITEVTEIMEVTEVTEVTEITSCNNCRNNLSKLPTDMASSIL